MRRGQRKLIYRFNKCERGYETKAKAKLNGNGQRGRAQEEGVVVVVVVVDRRSDHVT
jgi:hypothetical protein